MRGFRIGAAIFLVLSLVMVASYSSKYLKEKQKETQEILLRASVSAKEMEELEKVNERLKAKFEEIEKENGELKKKEQSLKDLLDQTLQKSDSELAFLRKSKEDLEKETEKQKEHLNEIENENREMKKKESSLEELLEQKRKEKDSLLKDLEKLEKQPQSQKECPNNEELSLSLISGKREVVCKNPGSRGKPIFVFVVGGEGTGHHLVANLIDKFPGVQRLSRHIQQLFAEMWEPAINEERKYEKRAELISLLKQVSDTAPPEQTHFVIQTSNFDMYSFPYDEPRNPLRRPDVLDLISLVEPHFDLRILVTMRDPMTSIVSLIRRNWWTMKMCESGVPVPTRKVRLYTEGPLGECGLIPVQARVVEDALVYINAQLLTVSREYFQTFRYEQFIDDPAVFVTPLANFLGFKPEDISELVTSHVQKRVEDYTQMLTEKQKETILSIFGRKQRPIYWKEMENDDWHILNFGKQKEEVWREKEICFA